MNDTPPAVDAMYRELLMRKSPAERVRMAASMHDAAKAILRAGIPADCRHNEVDLRIEVFRRFYRQDFSSEEMDRIVEGLRAHPRNRQ
jgi:glutamine synthetase type III